MTGRLWIWWYAPGVGDRKWAVAPAGARKEQYVVDEVVFRGVEARTMMTEGGRGVVEAEGTLIINIGSSRMTALITPRQDVAIEATDGV